MRVDFHCHTLFSKDSATPLERVLVACQRNRVDRIAITDHNVIGGALAAKALDPAGVIVGEEIMTQEGELLALYVTDEIPAGLSALEAIARLRAQGAFISVSHPFDRVRSGAWSLNALIQIAPLVDAIEIFNARSMWPGANRQAQAFAQQHHLPGTVGSDAHTAAEIGRAVLELPEFHDPATLLPALRQAQPHTAPSGLWVHLFSSLARWSKSKG